MSEAGQGKTNEGADPRGANGDSQPTVTVKDIARIAGVSIGTVDRAIHNRGRVSAETRDRILRAIADTGYSPNILASRLSRARTITLGVVMPEVFQDSGYWRLCFSGAELAARQLAGFAVAVRHFPFDRSVPRGLEGAVREALNTGVDGLLVAPIDSEQLGDALGGAAPAMVFFDSDAPGFSRIAYVGQDSFQSGLLAGKLMRMLLGNEAPASDFGAIRIEGHDYHLAERLRGYERYLDGASGFAPRYFSYVPPATNRADEIGNTVSRLASDILRVDPAIRGLFVPNVMVHQVAEAFARLVARGIAGTGRPRLIGYDLIPENVAAVKNGDIDFLLSQRPEIQGYEGVMTLYRAIVLKEKVVSHRTMPIDIITKENADSFQTSDP